MHHITNTSSRALRRAAAKAKQPLLARGAHKEVKFSNEGRASILKGVDVLADAVSVTLGPKGRNVIIEQSFGGPKITKDGVTVAKSISLKDKFENLGARLVQDVAQKTNEIAGDGTTTATVLARAIYAEGVKNVAAGCNPMDLRRGSQAAVDRVVEFLSHHTKTITTTAEIAQVATISANGDTHVGNLIAQAMEKVGKEGVITVKEGRTMEDEIEITEGMRFDRGFISPYFVTDPKNQKVEFEKPLILLSEKKISVLQDILPTLESAPSRHPASVTTASLSSAIWPSSLAVPSSPMNSTSSLKTLPPICSVPLDAIQARCEQIRALINDKSTSEFDRTKLQERLAKLSGGVAVIKVGGSSEVEVGEKKDRYDDALNATRAAVEEGILPGGGVALLKASLALSSNAPGSNSKPSNPDVKPIQTANFDQDLGVSIIKRALTHPARTILKNAGEEASVIVGTLQSQYGTPDKFAWGYDASKGEYVDMIKAGIVDPLKVVRTALVDAAGVASLLTTSEACVVEAPEENKPAPGMGGGMGGMGGMGF
ncbi:unnamed protein product [Somion occarium]|uniref:Heat shock protein 60 n=1 Tax=Somion occarium TaxID=3059160 RepID=A0ABP1E2X8_9APHY